MKEVVIISGKGGTGKTSIAASFAVLARDAVLVDCDVDAANLHLLLRPVVRETHEFKASKKAYIEPEKCVRCGLCADLCRFDAVKDYQVDYFSCEGCGVCRHACPNEAIVMRETVSGEWFVSRTPYGTMVHARLGVAEENSGKLVTLIKNKGRETAEAEKRGYVLVDGPPGIGCPVISSLAGASVALVVTEPTLSGVHDMERVLAVCGHFGVPAFVCINRYDLDEENTRRIEEYCERGEIQVVGRVPFDRVFTEALVKGVPVVEYDSGTVSRRIAEIWERLR